MSETPTYVCDVCDVMWDERVFRFSRKVTSRQARHWHNAHAASAARPCDNAETPQFAPHQDWARGGDVMLIPIALRSEHTRGGSWNLLGSSVENSSPASRPPECSSGTNSRPPSRPLSACNLRTWDDPTGSCLSSHDLPLISCRITPVFKRGHHTYRTTRSTGAHRRRLHSPDLTTTLRPCAAAPHSSVPHIQLATQCHLPSSFRCHQFHLADNSVLVAVALFPDDMRM